MRKKLMCALLSVMLVLGTGVTWSFAQEGAGPKDITSLPSSPLESGTYRLAGVTLNNGISIAAGAAVTIEVAAGTENNITGSYHHAGIYVPEGASLTLTGSGTLTVQGGQQGAGIGGNAETLGSISTSDGTVVNSGSCGDITVNMPGGTLNAYGGQWGAGIGHGDSQASSSALASCASSITIKAGTVNAKNDYSYGRSEGAAGIGTTDCLYRTVSKLKIIIEGGTVNAVGGGIGAGIGAGPNSKMEASNIRIGSAAEVTSFSAGVYAITHDNYSETAAPQISADSTANILQGKYEDLKNGAVLIKQSDGQTEYKKLATIATTYTNYRSFATTAAPGSYLVSIENDSTPGTLITVVEGGGINTMDTQKIVFQANGGSWADGTKVQMTESGKPVDSPAKSNDVFLGWSETSDGTTAVSNFAQGNIYYAIWQGSSPGGDGLTQAKVDAMFGTDNAKLTGKDTVTIQKDISPQAPIHIDTDITIDLNKHDIHGADGTTADPNGKDAVIVKDGSTLVVTGTGTVSGGNGAATGDKAGNGGNGIQGGSITVSKDAAVTGGNGTNGGKGGTGIVIADGSTVVVNGSINGGNGGSTEKTDSDGGKGGDGCHSNAAITGQITITGSGTITGGNGGNIPSSSAKNPGNGGPALSGSVTSAGTITTASGKEGVKVNANIDAEKAGIEVTVSKDQLIEAALTEEDKEASRVTITLSVKKEDSPAQEDKNLADKELSGQQKIGTYLDISVKKELVKNGSTTTEAIKTLSKPITITLAIPQGMRNGRDYRIIHVHGRKADVITPRLNGSGDTLSFEVEAFSTFAIAYTPGSGGGQNPGTGGSGGNSGHIDYGDPFWHQIEGKIQSADKNMILTVDAKSYQYMPAYVMKALREREDVSLVVKRDGAEAVRIPAGKALKEDSQTTYYKLSDLEEAYRGAKLSDKRAKVVLLKAKPFKKSVQLTWKKNKTGYSLAGYEIWRSTKKSSGYKKMFTSKKKYYINTKDVKRKTTYWYKVRGFRHIEGEKVFTDFAKIKVRTK